MLGGLKGAALLRGFRGSPSRSTRSGWRSSCAARRNCSPTTQTRSSELDVNPLICSGRRMIAVDGLIAKAA